MKWKSFKQEKPLDGQRILIYSPIMDIFYVDIYIVGEYSVDNAFLLTQFWCPVPCLPEDILKDVRNPLSMINDNYIGLT